MLVLPGNLMGGLIVNKSQTTPRTHNFPVSCIRIRPDRQIPDVIEDVLAGLLVPPRRLSPKYFYDDHGSLLFDRICRTDEYYLTRTEEALLAAHSKDIIGETMPDQILELGSGVSHKIRLLFNACSDLSHTCEYAPFDVCEEVVEQATERLATDYHWLDIKPLIGDYHAGLAHLPGTAGTRLIAFLGSTIGNFTAQQCSEFIMDIKKCLQPGDYFLLGADRIKDPAVLNAAYNDSEGLTAEFNLNMLQVINREINADFNLNNFSHYACFNADLGQMEMYLVSTTEQQVTLGGNGTVLSLAAGERILTEISRKFNTQELESMLVEQGFSIIQHFQPDNCYYSLLLSKAD